MNESIKKFESELRNHYLREQRLQNQEVRTGIPRKEYEDDTRYKKELRSKAEDYKTRVQTIDFIKPFPLMFTMSSSFVGAGRSAD
jgi:hypothetical protein